MKACGYCGGVSFRPLISDVRDRLLQGDETYSFVCCEGCGSSWLDPLPTPEKLASSYPELYGLGTGSARKSAFARILQSMELELWFKPVYRRNVRILSRYTGKRGELLDIGCGSGYQSSCFKDAGYSVTGIDFATGTAEMMRKRHGIEAFACSVMDLDDVIPGRQYDVITGFHVIEHTLTPDVLIKSIISHLRPGGTVFLSAPLAGSLQARLFGRNWGAYREAPRHVSLPSREGLTQLLARAGLDDVQTKSDHIFYIAGGALTSLSAALTMTSSYGSSAIVTAVKRFLGAGLAVLYLPAACVETLGKHYSMGLVVGRQSA